MREIKFRAWSQYKKIMWAVPTIGFGHDGAGKTITVEHIQGNLRSGEVAGESCQLMQFTGLRDKNGVEIYEGDILKTICTQDWEKDSGHEALQVVSWDENQYKFGLNLSCDLSWGGYENFEVIGNIYQNHELLKN